MPKTTYLSSNEANPFFEILADAEEIKVREIVPEGVEEAVSALHASLKNGVDCRATDRTFFVHVKRPARVEPPTAELTGPITPENRLYLLKSAELLIVESDHLLARNIFSYLLKQNIRDCDALKGLGQCFMKLGDTSSAKKCFRALWDIDPKEETLVWLGQCHIAEGNDILAIEQFKRVKNPGGIPKAEQFDLFKELGNCETRAGNFEVAWSHYHRALEVQPKSDVIYANLGTLESQRQHPEIALAYFQKALELNPKNTRALCGLGLSHLNRKNPEAAKKSFERSLDIDPVNSVALFQLIQLSASAVDTAPLISRLRRFLEKDPKNSEVHYALAVTLFKDSNWAECSKEVEALLTLSPQHAKGRALREELASHRHQPV